MKFKDGQSCNHPGCLHHLTHPCEECGRIGGIEIHRFDIMKNNPELHVGNIIQQDIFGVLWKCRIITIYKDSHMINVLPIEIIK